MPQCLYCKKPITECVDNACLKKGKAMKLVQWFFDQTDHMQWDEAKVFADKLCDEIIEQLQELTYCDVDDEITSWQSVKSEIEKL